jgi:hypothetical protein
VLWSSDDKEVLVWYYDTEAATAEAAAMGKTIEKHELEMAHRASALASGQSYPGECPESLEYSTVMEIRKWIYDDQEEKKRHAMQPSGK